MAMPEEITVMGPIDISGIDKAVLLVELHRHARVSNGLHSMAFLAEKGDLTLAEARELTASMTSRFDYVNGRVIKCDLRGDVIQYPALYDRDNGPGACARAVAAARARASDDR